MPMGMPVSGLGVGNFASFASAAFASSRALSFVTHKKALRFWLLFSMRARQASVSSSELIFFESSADLSFENTLIQNP
jgi:hypothetical protein